MLEYAARLLQVIDGRTIELDIDLGLDNVHIYKVVLLDKVDVPSIDDKLSDDRDKGMAAKQRLNDLLDKVEGGNFRIKTRINKEQVFVTIYIGGMNVNKTLIREGYAKSLEK